MREGYQKQLGRRQRIIRKEPKPYERSYFITTLTKDLKYFFGEVKYGQMKLSKIGRIARDCWNEEVAKREEIKYTAFIIMPNHIHVIISFIGENLVPSAVDKDVLQKEKELISTLMGEFKQNVLKKVEANNLEFAWKPRFNSQAIRNKKLYDRIFSYIIFNPKKWDYDKYNAERKEDTEKSEE